MTYIKELFVLSVKFKHAQNIVNESMLSISMS